MRWHPRSSGSGSKQSVTDEADDDDDAAEGGDVRGAARTVNGGVSNKAEPKGVEFERTVCGPDMVSGSMGRPLVHAGAGAGDGTDGGGGGGSEQWLMLTDAEGFDNVDACDFFCSLDCACSFV